MYIILLNYMCRKIMCFICFWVKKRKKERGKEHVAIWPQDIFANQMATIEISTPRKSLLFFFYFFSFLFFLSLLIFFLSPPLSCFLGKTPNRLTLGQGNSRPLSVLLWPTSSLSPSLLASFPPRADASQLMWSNHQCHFFSFSLYRVIH